MSVFVTFVPIHRFSLHFVYVNMLCHWKLLQTEIEYSNELNISTLNLLLIALTETMHLCKVECT
jgi:hypothetical protein